MSRDMECRDSLKSGGLSRKRQTANSYNAGPASTACPADD